MERVIKCLKFQTSRLTKLLAVFTLIYLAVYILIIILLNFQSDSVKGNISYFFTALTFAFLIPTILYKNTFNNLLMFGNTRRTILSSFFICAVALSAALTILSELSELLNMGLSHILSYISAFSQVYIYGSLSEPQKLLFFFTMFLMEIMIAYIYSALNYKFGKIFKMIFWCGLGLLFMIFSAFFDTSIGVTLLAGVKTFFGYNIAGGIYWCSLHFFIAAVVLGAILWLLARRQPQNA